MKSVLATLALLFLADAGMAQTVSVNAQFNIVHRSYNTRNPDHLYSLDAQEGPRAGFRAEPSGDFALSTYQFREFSRPVYRCRMANAVGHFLSSDSTCEGQIQEGFLGYAAYGPSPSVFKLTQLRRFVNGGHHVAEVGADYIPGFQAEGVLGFVIMARELQ